MEVYQVDSNSEAHKADRAPVRGEQVFFEDPAIDRMMGVVMTLAMEHYVLHDRVRFLEEVLVRRGLLEAGEAGRSPPPDAAAHVDAGVFIETLLRPLMGLQSSRGAAGSFSLRRGGAES